MAKVKFQLEMGGEKVRTMEQLREHFDIFEGMEYVENGKLVKWLKSRGEDELAETVSALDPQGTDCPKKLWRALGIAFDDQKYQLWDVLFRTSEGALGIAFNDLKYQQLLQIKRGEEERRKVDEKRKRIIEAEKTRQQEENAQREKIKRGEEERRKAEEKRKRAIEKRRKEEEEKAKFWRTNVVSASDYPEWAKVQREEDRKKAKERIAAEAEKKREEAKKAQMESVRRGEEERQKAEERKRNLSKTNVVSADDYLEWARMHREQ